MLKTFTLKNGIKVATYSVPEMKSVYLSITTKSGSIFDKESTNGAAHYMEHIIVEGTPTYPNIEVLTDYIEKMAGSYNATTGIDNIKFHINLPALYLEDAIQIAGEIFYQPLFPEASIEKERNAILGEIHTRQDALWYKNHQFYKSVRYRKNHPYLLDGGGSEKAIRTLQKKDLMDYWSKFFHPKNSYLVIVGGFDTEKIEQTVEKLLGQYDTKVEFPGYPDLTNDDLSDQTIAIRHDPELSTIYLDLSFPSMSDESTPIEEATMSIARRVLGGLSGSRLNRLLRLQKGLVYGVSFSAPSFYGWGEAGVSSNASVENIDEVIQLIVQELKGYLQNGPTDEELEFAKNNTINRVLMSFDHPGAIAGWIEDYLLWRDHVALPEEYVEIVKSVTKEMVVDLMKKYFDLSKLNLVLQGPIKNTPANIKKYQDMVKILV